MLEEQLLPTAWAGLSCCFRSAGDVFDELLVRGVPGTYGGRRRGELPGEALVPLGERRWRCPPADRYLVELLLEGGRKARLHERWKGQLEHGVDDAPPELGITAFLSSARYSRVKSV